MEKYLKIRKILEKYLKIRKDKKKIRYLTKLRISNHRLCIEQGRHHSRNTPFIEAEKRYCIFCKNKSVEDEKHFILDCKIYSERRNTFFTNINNLDTTFLSKTMDEMLQSLLGTKKTERLTHL